MTISPPRARYALVPVLLLELFAATAARAASINIQPILVGTGSSRLAADVLFASAIYEQVPLDVAAEQERPIADYTGTSLIPVTNIWYTNGSTILDTFLLDTSWRSQPLITVWYVNHIYINGSAARGITFQNAFGGEWRFGVAISLFDAVNDTLAHELAHVLTWDEGLGTSVCADPGKCLEDYAHHKEGANLLAAGSNRLVPGSIAQIQGQGGARDQITAGQADFMLLHSDFVIPDTAVPEPAEAALAGSGLALFCMIRLRRAA